MPRVDGSTRAAFGSSLRFVVGNLGFQLPQWVRRRHLLRSAFPALACKSGARHPWRARSAGQSIRYAIPASRWHRPKPSVAWAFGGVKVHWTFTCYRLTQWTFVLIRFTPRAPLLGGCCARMHECRGRRDAQERPSPSQTCCTGTYECRERRMQVNGLSLRKGAKNSRKPRLGVIVAI